MKITYLNIALLSIFIAFSSCNKISESIQQDIIISDTVNFDIPKINNVTSLVTIPGIASKLNIEAQLKNNINSFTIDQIKSANLKTITMALDTINDPDSLFVTNNFGNLESVKFRIGQDGNLNNIANSGIGSGTVILKTELVPAIKPETLKPILINYPIIYNLLLKGKVETTKTMKVSAVLTYTLTVAN